jgi:hypothetical protein
MDSCSRLSNFRLQSLCHGEMPRQHVDAGANGEDLTASPVGLQA